uniref:Immunoglobulin I-set domain-containing protein n=1 Tax=Glossina brevipalpis TaxID=37001 RepID=A0A1A9X096_9MUSC
MRLTITNVQKSDYGSYKCVAKNPRGEMDGTIKLYMSSPPTTLPPPTTTTLYTTAITSVWNENERAINGIGPTHSVIVIDKLGTKYQSNLNEIDKSEQKLMGQSPKGYDWSKDKRTSSSSSSTSYYFRFSIHVLTIYCCLSWTYLKLILISRLQT